MSWALVVLACPVLLVLTEYVLVPLLARTVLHGRLHIGSASLLRGVHDVVWRPAAYRPLRHLAVRRIALVWTAPHLWRATTTRSRLQWLCLRIEGTHVVVAPPSEPPPPPRPGGALTDAFAAAPLWLRRAARACAYTLQRLAQSLAALALNFIALEVVDTRVCTAHAPAELVLDDVQVHATVLLAYVQRRRPGLAKSGSDGFADEPTRPAPSNKAPRGLVPEGRLRASLHIGGVRLLATDSHQTIAHLPDRSSLTVRAKVREKLVPQDVDVRVALPDLAIDLAAARVLAAALARAPRSASPQGSRGGRNALAHLHSASLELRRVELRQSLPGTPSAALRVLCEHLNVSLEPSDPSDAAHQAWFGTCGVQRRGLGVRLHEARRLWHLRAHCASAQALLHTPSEAPGTLLASMAHLSSWARTSTTPFGMLAARPQRASQFFTSDPNEAAITLRVRVEHVRGAPDLTSLVRLRDALDARRSAPRPARPLPVLPRIAAVVQIDALDVVVRREQSAGPWSGDALVLSIPRMHLTVQGAYSERVHDLHEAWIGAAPYGGHEACPLHYSLDSRAGAEAIDMYLSAKGDAKNMHYDLLHMGAPELVLALRAPASVDVETWAPHLRMPQMRSRLAVSVQHVDVHLWQAPVLETLAAVLAALARTPKAPAPPAAPLERLPPLRLLHIGIGRTTVLLGSSDTHFDPAVRRGVGLLIGHTVVEMARVDRVRPFSRLEQASRDARKALRLPEHIDTQARSVAAADGRGAAVSLVLKDVRLCPLVHIGAALSGAPPGAPPEAVVATDRWDFGAWSHVLRAPRRTQPLHQLARGSETLHVPDIQATVGVRAQAPQVHVDATATGPVALRIALTHTYCVLMAVHTAHTLLQAAPRSTHSAPQAFSVHVSAHVPLVHWHIDLPNERRVMAHVHGVRVRVREGIRVSLATLIACVPSETAPPAWEEGVVLRRLAVSFGEQRCAPRTIFVTGDCLQVRIPYAYHTHRLIEGSIVAFKASKQLFFQIVRGRTDSVIYPHAEAPKHIPPVFVRFGIAVFEAADHSLDSALNLIFRAGLDEQLMRLERDRLFDLRAQQANAAVPPGARARLDAVNSSNWVRRWHNAQHVRAHRERSLLSYIHRRVYDARESADAALPIDVLPRPMEPPLVRLTMTHVCVDVSAPLGYALEDTHHWLHTQAGNPVDLAYTTLVPLHVRWRASDGLLRLRDYPVPLLHIPPRSDMAPSFDAEGDVCVAEQLGDEYSVRHIHTIIVPALDGTSEAEHGLLVPKSTMSPKLYGPVTVHVASENPTQFGWSQSIQPGLQDLQRVFDSITSPPHDPSPKPGPWDKLPLQLQARLHIFFDTDVQLLMKGTRDPYDVLHSGAGWVLSWRDHVELRLGFENADREFLQVRSGEHVLAVPDLRHLVDPAAVGLYDIERGERASARAVLERTDVGPHIPLAKISWQLAGGVRWGMGLISEHTCTDATCERTPRCEGAPFYRKCRFFGRKPHWDVRMRSFEGYARLPSEAQVDSYGGWRSDFVHLSVSLQAIGTGDRQVGDMHGAARNSLYITSRTWNHFRDWQRLFNGRLSLPIRQGRVFPARPGVKSPKFGRFLGTFKYRFMIAPLHVSHMFMQPLRYDLLEGVRTHVGLKAQCSTFYLDMHQRMQETVHRPPAPGAQPTRSRRKPLYEAELDVSDLELYSVCARFPEMHGRLSVDAGSQLRYDVLGDVFRRGHDAEHYATLYDRLDFEELGALPLGRAAPRLHYDKVATLLRINLHRLVEPPPAVARRDASEGPPVLETYSKFGHEDSHTCLIGRSRVVMDEHLALEQQRLRQLAGDVHGLEVMLASPLQAPRREQHAERLTHLRAEQAQIEAHIARLEAERTEPPSQASDPRSPRAPVVAEWHLFHNQVWVHHPVAVLTNETRAVLLRYVESVALHMSFLQRLSVTEQHQMRELLERARTNMAASEQEPDAVDHGALLDDLRADMARLASITLGDAFLEDFGAEGSEAHAPGDGIADEFSVRKHTVCVCVEPELVLHSRAGPHSTVLLHAAQLRLRTYAVSDMMYDERSTQHHVLFRHYASLKALQCFHSARTLEGADGAWGLDVLRLPPAVLDGETEPGVQQLMPPIHTFVRFDQHNRQRLHDPARPVLDPARVDDLAVNYLTHQMDMVQVLCPRLTLTATSAQYAAMYYVATDLLLYTDPLQKEHERRRDSLAYSFTFDDPAYVVGLLASYQARIHDLLNVRRALEDKYTQLNTAGLTEYVRVSLQLLDLYADLCMFEEAVFLSHASARDKSKHLALLVRVLADAVEWNMVGTETDPRDPHGMHTRFQLQGTALGRLALTNGTSFQGVRARRIEAHNAHPSAYFEDILTPYFPSDGHPMIDEGCFLRAQWLQLPPVGGVKIMDRCELHLHPFKAQLELKVGKQIMEYLFGTRRARRDDDDDDVRKRRWLRHIVAMSRRARNTLAQRDASDSDTESDGSLSDSGSETSERTVESSPVQPPALWDMDEDEDVDTEALKSEMVQRASTYVSFVHIVVAAVAVCLSYKGDGEYSLTNLYDLEIQLPRLEYRHLLGTYSDLTDLLRRDLIRIAWNHRNTLIKGVISTNARKHQALKKTREHRLLMYTDDAPSEDSESSTPSSATLSPAHRRLPPLPASATAAPPLPPRTATSSPAPSESKAARRPPIAARLHDAVEDTGATRRHEPTEGHGPRLWGRLFHKKDK
ncbi:hypothetical protein MCAP1_003436 [Malassezia caprae]|uniref:Uncharacterized protein n=1 Tax=Malassezia caprae TaxID=1381934 RepID=A0AAF0J1M3_9BASI|nr:hypothetical protein MCAP1_003436 [Malassezia caprae]